jgi:sulfur-oxidizing protein SoxY
MTPRIPRQATDGVPRRAALSALGSAGIALMVPAARAADDPEVALVEQLFAGKPVPSERLRLEMPPYFPNGYTVPAALEVDGPLTEADHVRSVHVVAPANPLIRVASFHFTPLCGRARVATRMRLARTQNVIAVAEMSDGTLLMAKTRVEVEIDGCA